MFTNECNIKRGHEITLPYFHCQQKIFRYVLKKVKLRQSYICMFVLFINKLELRQMKYIGPVQLYSLLKKVGSFLVLIVSDILSGFINCKHSIYL